MFGVPSRLARVLIPIATVIAVAALGCATGNRHYDSIALDSGLDKKVAHTEGAMGMPAATPPMAPGGTVTTASSGNSQFDENYRTPMPSSRVPGDDANTPYKPTDPKAVGSKALDGFPDIESWFAPKAYAADNQVSEKYLIRTGSVSVKLDNIDDGQKKATAIATQYGGAITDTSITKDSAGYHSGTITLRVPAEKFQEVWNALLAIGEVTSQQISTQDVGGDYVSAVSHLKALAAEQETLQKMFDEALAVQRARGLGEAYKVLLDTEERLKAVSEEIQSTEDHVKQLADQITRSTITLSLTENPKLPGAAPPDKFSWGIGATFNQAVRDLMGTARGLLNGLIYFVVSLQWVWWLLFFLAARWGWKYYKKVMAGEKDKPAVVTTTKTE